MCANTACNTIKKQSSADNTMRTHQLESDPCVVGWSAHRLEELANSGKIIRPAYKGISEIKDYVPIEKR